MKSFVKQNQILIFFALTFVLIEKLIKHRTKALRLNFPEAQNLLQNRPNSSS